MSDSHTTSRPASGRTGRSSDDADTRGAVDGPGLSAPVLRAHLQRGDVDCEVVGTTGSTNDDLVARARALAPERAILRAADQQTAGRGRRGRSWQAAPGSALLFSLALPWRGAPAASAPATLACGLAAARCLGAAGVQVAIKWPNDLLLGGRKLGGILAEMVEDLAGQRTLVVGMGLNLHLDAPTRAAIGQPAAALGEVMGDTVLGEGRERWLARLANALIDALRACERHGFAPLRGGYNERLAYVGQAVQVGGPGLDESGGPLTGVVVGVDEQGRLLLRTAGTVRALASGDLSLRAHAGGGMP